MPPINVEASLPITPRIVELAPATSPQLFSFPRSDRLGTRRFGVLGLCHPHRKHSRHPQEQKIERKEDDEADLAAKLTFGDEADDIGGEIARDHEDDVIDDEPHDKFPLMPIALAGNAQPMRQGRRSDLHFGARPALFNIFLTQT